MIKIKNSRFEWSPSINTVHTTSTSHSTVDIYILHVWYRYTCTKIKNTSENIIHHFIADCRCIPYHPGLIQLQLQLLASNVYFIHTHTHTTLLHPTSPSHWNCKKAMLAHVLNAQTLCSNPQSCCAPYHPPTPTVLATKSHCHVWVPTPTLSHLLLPTNLGNGWHGAI